MEPDDGIDFVEHWAPGLPFCPQLPGFQKRERMLDQLLGGMEPYEVAALPANECLSLLLDTPLYESLTWTWEAFLYRLGERTPQSPEWVKVQFAGPSTAAACLRSLSGRFLDYPPLSQIILKRILTLTADAASALMKAGYHVIVQLDEPAIAEGGEQGLELLRMAVDHLRAMHLQTMVHCCDRVEAGHFFFQTGADVLSFDTAMHYPTPSLVREFQAHLELGGAIAWGVIPTDSGNAYEAERHLKHALDWWRRMRWRNLADASLVTPACGLANHDLNSAAVIMRLCHAYSAILADFD